MKRLFALIVAVVALVVVVAATSNAAKDGVPNDTDTYIVRATFDDAAAAANGEDVKVAGARVGAIDKMDVSADNKAVLTLHIEDKRFIPFHQGANCTLRPEGVLAVKFVECDPGRANQPALERIQSGPGKGQYDLSVQHTSSPVDFDLVNDIMREPSGQQFAILLSEFGVGLAGRGSDLNAVIHRANPALRQTDRVLKLLGRQSDALAQFATDADTVLTALAKDREHIAGFIKHARRSGEASAERQTELSASIERLPKFLTSLRNQMILIQGLNKQAIPTLQALEPAAPELSRAVKALGPFARAARPALIALGDKAPKINASLQRTRPLLKQLKQVGQSLRRPAKDLDDLTASFEDQFGIKNLLGVLYGATNAVNGFDSVGHYVRGESLTGVCSEYRNTALLGCDAQWGPAAKALPAVPSLGDLRASVLDYLLGE